MPAEAHAGAAQPTRTGLVAYGLGLAFFAAYQQFKLPVVLPTLLAEHGYDRLLAGGFMSVYAVMAIALSIALGRMVQRYGTDVPVVIAMGLFLVACAATLHAPHSGLVVLAARALEGVAFVVLAICGPVLANAFASPRALPLVIGLTAAWIPGGQLVAALLAPVALATGGWGLLWWVGIALSLAFVAWTWRLARAADSPLRPRGARRGALAPPRPMAPDERRSLALAGAVFLVFSGQYFAYMTWLPQYLVEEHGLAVDGALWGYVLPVAMVFASCFATGLALRAGAAPGPMLAAGLAVEALVWWTLPWVGAGAAGIASLVVYGASSGVVPTCLFAMPSAVLGTASDTARAFGVVMTGRSLGVLVGPVLLAQIFKITGTWDLASPVMGVFTTAGCGLAVALAIRLRRTPDATQTQPIRR